MVENGNTRKQMDGTGVSREWKRKMERLARVEEKNLPRYYNVVVGKSPSILSGEPHKMVRRA